MIFEKIFPTYTMDFNSFCKALTPYLTGVAIGALCRLFVEELQKIRDRKRAIKFLREFLEASEKYIEESKVQTQEVAASRNNDLKE